ncbi:DIM6/NTAB family flavoprotein oxygenase [Candidatus Kinetoplastibacterium desouzaii TCC079E]|uniref:DIM6/NTAB family flavoprotein oxygenase n=1 Tax=Candidatus Kinetoplastidibacterium desouzai TCC079E TaxID=1208919 RepID=M1LN04_9PROT|nr:flavin reductase family protein [Candidatus Kinetoplastibacterium desouzaii]AGF47102.1 DIM6/NTAB family flavoprotein oxygenase [Candidatus Kinetoplastibacterium desouzaii TCC079E]
MLVNFPTDQQTLRKSLGMFSTGVAIVTTNDSHNKAFGLTINSFSSLSLDPPFIIWNISIKSTLKDIFQNSKNYVVHILTKHHTNIANIFAKKDILARFNGIDTKLSPSGTIMIEKNFMAWFDCYNYKQYEEGDHIIMIGRIEHLYYDNNNSPLIFCKGTFHETNI